MVKTAFVYTEAYTRYIYSETHPLKPYRLRLTRDVMESYGLLHLSHSQVIETVPASRQELELFHTPEYLEVLAMADRVTDHHAYLAYGLGPGDNPIFPGMYVWSQLCAGGTLQAARRVESGNVDTALHIAGGLHHAMASRASGFCYINDAVLALADLVAKGYRVAYIDIDVHHGDGVQAAFYDTDQVLTISLHESGAYLFPGTGFVHEVGVGKGRGYAVNLPLPPGVDDAAYVEAFMAVVPPLVEAYQPDFVLTQLGVDTFREDPLAHGQLTTAGFTDVLRQIKSLAPRWIATGGGGYHLPNVARAWTLAWGIMNDIEVPDRLPDTALASLRREGYRDITLRDPEVSWHPSHRDRMRADVQQTVASLKQHVFPLHGLRT